MCFDTSTGVLYVSGGRIVGTDMCSGLYAYHTVDKEWLCLVADQSANVPLQSALPRSGHVTLFHPRQHQLYVIGGQRQQQILSDMLTYDVKSGETSILADGKEKKVPVVDLTLRAALDLVKDQICVTGMKKQEQREVLALWLYDIPSAQWSRVTRCECDIPVDRFAHSFVCDSTQDCYYMFGGHQGNVAQASSNMMRLDDFWKMQLIRQSKPDVLRECQLLLRKQRYLELSSLSPVDAVVYLKTSVSAVVDHGDHQQSRQYRELTGSLFDSEVLLSGKESSTHFQKMRSELYDDLAARFPSDVSQPTDNLIDFIKLKH